MYTAVKNTDTSDMRDSEKERDEESLLSHNEGHTEGFLYGSRWLSFEIYHRLPDCIQTIHQKLRNVILHLNDSSPSLRTIVMHCSLIIAYTAVYFIMQSHHPSQQVSNVLYTPAQAAIVPEIQTLKVKINETFTPYNGPPSPEVDAAWGDLFKYANIRITKEEVQRLGRPSIPLADGSGDYFGSLDVYHQLHCLKYIRQYVHQDYYELGHTNVPNTEHVNHCIEMLRQVVMCKADTAMMTYKWLPDFPGPWPNFGIDHQCVNWEHINEWSKARSFDLFDPNYLQHPTFGFPYAHLKGLPPQVVA